MQGFQQRVFIEVHWMAGNASMYDGGPEDDAVFNSWIAVWMGGIHSFLDQYHLKTFIRGEIGGSRMALRESWFIERGTISPS